MDTWDPIGMLIGAIITLMVGSYLIGDNIFYRWALAILVGISVGYALGMTLLFLRDWIIAGLHSENIWEQIYYLVPMLMGLLLLLKGFHPSSPVGRLAILGDLSLGFLVGVGAAVAVAGALQGTLVPQTLATGKPFASERGVSGLVEGIIVALGTIAALQLFSPRPIDPTGKYYTLHVWLRRLGRGFIIVSLAVTFAGMLTSGLTLLMMRLWRLVELIQKFLPFSGS